MISGGMVENQPEGEEEERVELENILIQIEEEEALEFARRKWSRN